jgi:hypothetical protein
MDGQRTEDEFRLEQFFEVGMWGPLISPLQKGGFLVCWVIYDTSLAGVYGQLFSSTGKKTGGVFLVNTCTRLDQTDPQIELLGEDRLLACWMSQEQDGSGWGIYGQILTSDGQKTEKEFQINTHTEGDQFFPTVISLQDSGLAACWQSDGQDGSGTGVFAKRYPASPLVHALVPFDLMRPSDGNSIKNTNPTLSWHQASTRIVCYPWELDYRVYVDDNPSFLSPQVIEQDQDTTFVLQNLTPGTTYFWKVLAKNISGDSLWSSNTNAFFVAYDATSVVDIGQAKTPKEFTLHQNYPNPFNPETTIRFDLPATGFVQIAIYNISGKLVKVLMRESRTGGNYSVKWNGRDSAGNATPSGIYICRMEVRSADGRRFTRSVKMGLVR